MHALAGRWSEAARELDRYLKEFPKGPEQREAERYGARHAPEARLARARVLLEDLAGKQETAVDAARWGALAALAAAKDGDWTHATARWTEIARSRSLTWPALVARARLREHKAPSPPRHRSAGERREPWRAALGDSAPVDVFHASGLEDEAEEELHAREATVASSAGGVKGSAAHTGCSGARASASSSLRKSRASSSLAPPRRRAPGPGTAPIRARSTRASRGSSRPIALPTGVVFAVMRQESGFRPEVVSPARAVGLLQLMPKTAARVAASAGVPHEESRLVEPLHNIDLGTRYLEELLTRTKGSVVLAVAGYNAGLEAVGAVARPRQGHVARRLRRTHSLPRDA